MGEIVKIIIVCGLCYLFGTVLIGLVIFAPVGWALYAFALAYAGWKLFRMLMRGSYKGGAFLGRKTVESFQRDNRE